jgi:hypothetical protein
MAQSNVPPLPPEMPTEIIPEPPPPAAPLSVPAPEPPPRRGCSGCAWATIGALGCLVVLLIPIAAVVFVGGVSFNNIIGTFRDLINKPPVRTATIVLERVQALSQLTTVRYNFSGVVTTESDMPDVLKALYGQKQLFLAVGHINAGIDLSQLKPGSVQYQNETLTIQLPPPTLQDCFLDENQSYVMEQSSGVFAPAKPNLITESRQFAVKQFRDNALKEGILNDVQKQSQTVIENLVKGMELPGVAQIQVVPAPPDPNAKLPETCQ